MKIELKNISKSFNDKEVLKDISYTFTSPNLYCILSPSGEGKSTLLSILGLLDSPSSGELLYDDELVDPKDETNFISKHISFTFQDYNLFENLTVYENLSLFEADREKLTSLLKEFKLDISLDSKVKYLSGGERQRLSIIRSLLKGGDVFLFDEPSGNLDEVNAYLVFDLIKEVSKTKLCIVVTHNTLLAYQYGDHILKLVNHNLVDSGSSSNILTLDIKNRGLEAFEELINLVKLRNSGVILHYHGKDITTNMNNVFAVINEIYKENTAETLSISYSFISDLSVVSDDTRKGKKRRFFSSYGARNFRGRVGRSVISLILILLIGAVSLFEGNFLFYNYGKEVEKALNAEDIPYASLDYKDTYQTGYMLHYYTSDDTNYYPMYSCGHSEGSNYVPFHLVLVQDDTFVFEGNEYFAPTDGTVMVTDTLQYLWELFGYLSPTYDIKIDSMSVEGSNFYLPLSFSSEYITTPLGEDYRFGHSVSEVMQYNYAFISYDSFVSIFKEEVRSSGYPSIPLKTNNILSSYNNLTSSSSFIRYTEGEYSVTGNSIKNDDEIIISRNLVSNYSDNQVSNLIIGQELSIKDLLSLSETDQFKDNYDFNLYDYAQSLKIVGVTSDINDSIIVSEKIYDDILSSIPYSLSVSIETSHCKSRVNKLYKNDVFVDERVVWQIDSFLDDYKVLSRNIYLIAVLVMSALFVVMICLSASALIKDRYRDIAIMKSLGLKNSSIFISFFLTLLIPLLIGTAVGIGVGCIFNAVFNSLLLNPEARLWQGVEGFPVNFLPYNVWSFLVPILICVVVTLVVTFIYMRRISKKEAFSSLKEFRE